MADRSKASPYIDLWQDFRAEFLVQELNSKRNLVGVTGLSGLVIRISATEQGAAIGALTGAVTETSAVDAPGYYYRTFDRATLNSELPIGTYPHGAEVWLQFEKPGDVDVEPFKKIIRRTRS